MCLRELMKKNTKKIRKHIVLRKWLSKIIKKNTKETMRFLKVGNLNQLAMQNCLPHSHKMVKWIVMHLLLRIFTILKSKNQMLKIYSKMAKKILLGMDKELTRKFLKRCKMTWKNILIPTQKEAKPYNNRCQQKFLWQTCIYKKLKIRRKIKKMMMENYLRLKLRRQWKKNLKLKMR